MRILTILCVCLVTALQTPVKAGPLVPGGRPSVKFIGEGGTGYVPPSPEASDAMEHGSWQQTGLWETIGSIGDAPKPQEHVASRPDPVSYAPLIQPRTKDSPPAPEVAGSKPAWPFVQQKSHSNLRPSRATASAEEPVRRYTLWEGLQAPLQMPLQKISEVSLDGAREMGREDYESHILGQRSSSSRGTLAGSMALTPPAKRTTPAAFESPHQGEVFVALHLDLKGADLKDAVAAIPGFRQDMRFEPAASRVPGQVMLWGWLPAGRVGEAMRQPTVSRLDISAAAHHATPTWTTTEVLIGLRTVPGALAGEEILRLEREMATPGFRVKLIGTQSAPGTGEKILVVKATIPVAALSRLQARADVLKVVPALSREQASETTPRSGASEDLRQFFSRALARSPLLLLVSLLMLVPAIGDGLLMALRVFIPYRR